MTKRSTRLQGSSSAPTPSIASIHATPIWICSYPNHPELKSLVEELAEDSPTADNEANPGLVHHFEGESVLHRSSFADFRDWVETEACHYAEQAFGVSIVDGFTVTDSWVNSTKAGGGQQPHIHVNSYISGTYYLSITHEHPPLVFPNPRRLNNPGAPCIALQQLQPTPFTTDAAIHPQEGQLLLWESHLLHGYPPATIDGRRSLSMNLMPRVTSNGRYAFRASAITETNS